MVHFIPKGLVEDIKQRTSKTLEISNTEYYIVQGWEQKVSHFEDFCAVF